MHPRIRVLLPTAALLFLACDGGGDARRALPPLTTGSPTVTGAPAPVKTVAPVPDTPKGWGTYAYNTIGLRFAYPPLTGRVTENSRSDTGTRHSWIIRRTDRCNPRGECRAYEFAAVNDGCPDGAPWPTFAHRWTETASTHRIATCAGKSSFAVGRALRTIERPDGIRAIVYDANVWFGPDVKVPGALAAVLNFPDGYDERYRAIAFYFDDPLSLDIVERVLRLVTLTG